ncbi:hypothetical protein EI613_11865 [Azospirillum sp. 412522]|nr:hypothetical protein [Azospirillum sp. 412522]
MTLGGFNTALEATNREAFCIECHKGIAHRLPDMRGVPPGWSGASDDPQKPIGHWLADGRGQGR